MVRHTVVNVHVCHATIGVQVSLHFLTASVSEPDPELTASSQRDRRGVSKTRVRLADARGEDARGVPALLRAGI